MCSKGIVDGRGIGSGGADISISDLLFEVEAQADMSGGIWHGNGGRCKASDDSIMNTAKVRSGEGKNHQDDEEAVRGWWAHGPNMFIQQS